MAWRPPYQHNPQPLQTTPPQLDADGNVIDVGMLVGVEPDAWIGMVVSKCINAPDDVRFAGAVKLLAATLAGLSDKNAKALTDSGMLDPKTEALTLYQFCLVLVRASVAEPRMGVL